MRIAGFIASLTGGIGAGALGLSWLRGTGCHKSEGLGSLLPGNDPVVLAGYLLIVALVLGCIGGLYLLQRRGNLAGPLLLAGGVAPGLIEPRAFVVTFLLILAGLIAQGVGRRQHQGIG